MSIKDIFEQDNPKVLTSTNLEELGAEIESEDYVDSYVLKQNKFTPPVDFSQPKNFAKFGLAARYYTDTIERIYQDFPYDGSLYEKTAWHNSSSYLDNYIFENEYPRTNGHVTLSYLDWGTQVTASDGYGATATSSYDYIRFTGGPHSGNIYDLTKDRGLNLRFGGAEGATVEFWLKKSEFISSLTEKEVILDVWSTGTISGTVAGANEGYARLRIEMSATAGASDPSPFYITYMSGADGFANEAIGSSNITTASVADDIWHHYAFTFQNDGDNVAAELYFDGTHDASVLTGTSIGHVSSSLAANIGALVTRPSGTFSTTVPYSAENGWGKLSASMDEFRFWKARRNPQQIGRYRISQVGGGSNTDEANTKLGVYYKFNEGISQTSSVDSIVLDYSGRMSNGSWTGYQSGARSLNSAIVESSASTFEYKDPIIYSFHSDVLNLKTRLNASGSEWDRQNTSALYYSYPSWIIEEDEERAGTLLKLTQIIASYFDTLFLQIEAFPRIKDIYYADGTTGSFKPLPFAEDILQNTGFLTPEIFADATALEFFLNRNEEKKFTKRLHEVKSYIYQNIYNNLTYIYKSKGTERGLRNVLRCFGVDDELVRINTYAENSVYQFRDNLRATAVRRKYIDFYHHSQRNSNVYQYADSSNSNSVSYINGRDESASGSAVTVEAEVLFPKALPFWHDLYVPYHSTASCLFGAHTAIKDGVAGDVSWDPTDSTNFKVLAVRNRQGAPSTYFRLTGSSGGFVPTLTSSLFLHTYNNEKWNFAVRVKPSKYPLVSIVEGTTGSTTSRDPYVVEFYGVNTLGNQIKNEFIVSGTMTYAQGAAFITSSTRLYVGAHRTNFTGSLIDSTDVKIGSLRYWTDYVPDNAIREHSKDVTNFGTEHPQRSIGLFHERLSGTYIPQMETLALNWEFSNISGSDDNGQFTVDDISSGSTELTSRHSWVGSIVKNQHTGRGHFFDAPPNHTSSYSVEYIHTNKKQLPETLGTDDAVQILTDDDVYLARDFKPIKFIYGIEKSMYQVISEEILNFFSSVKDFNNLIGEPVNRYRQEYKDLNKLRQYFFERVQNTPDIEKFVEYFKWIDSSVWKMLEQLIPASSNFIEGLRNVVESHVLERNKYWTKMPTLDLKRSDPEGQLLGINELLYDWEFGHSPNQLFNLKSIAFNGANNQSQLTVSDHTSLSFGADGTAANEPSFTFSSWINMTDASRFYILGKRNTSTSKSEYVWYVDASDKLILLINDTNTTNFIANAADAAVTSYEGQWIHVCTTYDGSGGGAGIKMYINGSAVAMASPSTGGSYTAMDNTNADFFIGRSAANTANLVAEGFIDETAVFNKELTVAEISKLHRSGLTWDLNNFFHAKDHLVSWWRMGDKATGTSPNFTIPDQIGDNDAVMTVFQDTETSKVVTNAPPSTHTNENENCLWWKERAERTNPVISSGDVNIDSEKDGILKILTTKTSASGPSLSGSSGIYEGSSYVLRNLSLPYKFSVDESIQIHGGSNFHPNKQAGIFKAEADKDDSTSFLVVSASSVDSFENCTDNSGLTQKRKHSFGAYLRSEVPNFEDKDSYLKTKGALFSPFSLHSASNDGGYSDTFTSSFKAGIDITNLHEDSYGPWYETPLQGHFTEKYVGGLQYRHVAVNTGSDDKTNRPEGWWLTIHGNTLFFYGPGADTQDRTRPKANRFREPMAKRPVNIKNILQKTGSTIIGNYEHDYQIIQTSGRRTNNRYFVKNEGITIANQETSAVSGVIDFTLPDRNISGSNDFVFVERFSAPGGPEVMSRGFLDVEAEEYSIYNALPWRNLTVRQPLNSLLTKHCGQFGYDIDTGYGYTASFHKVHRNSLKRIEGDLTTGYVTGTTYDNWYVRHAIPRSETHYAWITASVDYSASARFSGYTGKRWYESSSVGWTGAIGFVSASDFVGWDAPGYTLGTDKNILLGAGIPDQDLVYGDFAGLNTIIYEPVSSSENTLGYPLGTSLGSADLTELQYRNVTFFTNTAISLVAPGAANLLMLKRNGPYGWPSWKQIRGYEHPIVKSHKKQNIISHMKAPKLKVIKPFTTDPFEYPHPHPHKERINLNYQEMGVVDKTFKKYWTIFVTNKQDRFKNYNEPVVVSRYKPILHHFEYEENKTFQTTTLKYTHANNLSVFTHVELRMDLDYYRYDKPKDIFTRDQKIQIYDSLLSMYIDDSPLEPFKPRAIYCSEDIFPREINTFASSIRSRQLYAPGFWKERGTDRLEPPEGSMVGVYNSQGEGGDEAHVQSIWPLDPRDKYDDPALPSTSSGDGAGELQNNYCIFYNDAHGHPIKAGALYARPIPFSGTTEELFSGDTLFEVADQSGRAPFPEHTYDKWIDEIKRVGKDYSVIPEFRISEHLDHYMMDASGGLENYLKKNISWLSLTGTAVSASNEADFYKVYGMSDFLKYFSIIRDDHEDIFGKSAHGVPQIDEQGAPTGKVITVASIGSEAEIRLKCKALMKFLPYDGFYPALRTVQLAQLMSQSYASTNAANNDKWVIRDKNNNPASWAAAMKPFYAPGIMFNSIKSGVAVDYPVYISPSHAITGTNSGEYWDVQHMRISESTDTNFFKRFPFERLLAPHQGNPSLIYDLEPHASASLDATSSLRHHFDDRYTIGINNFLAEVPSFFLRGGEMTQIESGWESEFETVNLDSDGPQEYTMRIVLSHGTSASYEDASKSYAAAGEFSPIGQTSKAGNHISYVDNPRTITMYDRQWSAPLTNGINYPRGHGSSFGPPFVSKGIRKGVLSGVATPVDRPSGTYEPYTPPYFDGYSHVELTFRPDSLPDHILSQSKGAAGQFSLSQILNNLTATFARQCTQAFHVPTTDYPASMYWAYTGSHNPAVRHSMQITASINISLKRQKKFKVTYATSTEIDSEVEPGYPPDKFEEHTTDGEQYKWVIQPKWETPILDFANVDATVPEGAPSSENSFSGSDGIAKGMWHQYGSIPEPGTGLTLSIQDDYIGKRILTDAALTASLAKLVGFKKDFQRAPSRKLGQLANEKVIKEAVVAIPFWWPSKSEAFNLNSHEPNFFELDPNAVKKYLGLVDGDPFKVKIEGKQSKFKNAITPAGARQIDLMKRYVFPPHFDFIQHIGEWGNRPMPSMAIFEFGHTLKQNDLLNIWQNVSPDIGIQWKEAESTLAFPLWTSFFDTTNNAMHTFAQHFDLDQTSDVKLPYNIQWIVFKVKQRAKTNYYAERADGDPARKLNIDVDLPFRKAKEAAGETYKPAFQEIPYSYNWPYDYFSLVELVRLNATVKTENQKRREDETNTMYLMAKEQAAAELKKQEKQKGANKKKQSDVWKAILQEMVKSGKIDTGFSLFPYKDEK